MELTIKNLENCFNGAIKNNAKYLGIKVQLKERFCSQIIINERNNFDSELDFFKKTYNENLTHKHNEDLTHKHNEKIKIIGFTYGNTFEEIERDLCKVRVKSDEEFKTKLEEMVYGGKKDKNRTNKIENLLEDAKNLILNSKHYSGKIETIDYMKDKLTDEQFEGYLMRNVIKYLSRYNKKDKEYEDLNKAFTYLLWLMHDKREDKNEQAV